jgi:hypothetical protein
MRREHQGVMEGLKELAHSDGACVEQFARYVEGLAAELYTFGIFCRLK